MAIFKAVKRQYIAPLKMNVILVEQLEINKTQSNDLFISPKRKKTILKIGLKSFILSKRDH